MYTVLETVTVRRYVLLFDRDCGICSAFSRWVHAADLRRRVDIRAIQTAAHLFPGVPRERIFGAFHVVAPDGRVTTGGDAVPTLVEAFPAGAGLATILRGSATLTSAVHASYRFLSRFRERLVCRLEPSAPSAGSGP